MAASSTAGQQGGTNVWTLRDVMTVEEFRTILFSQQATESVHVTVNGVMAGTKVAIVGDTSPGTDGLELRGTTTEGRLFMIVRRQRYLSGPPLPEGRWVRLDPANTTAPSVTLNSWLLASASLMDTSRLIGGPSNAAVRREGSATIDGEPVTTYRADTAGGPTTVYVDAHNRLGSDRGRASPNVNRRSPRGQ